MTARRGISDTAGYGWENDSIYCAATALPEEIIVQTTDDSEWESPAARRQRIEEAGQRFLDGKLPFLLSASLMGPFDRESGWINPWQSKSDGLTCSRTPGKHCSHEAFRNDGHVNRENEQLVDAMGVDCHLPSPASIKQASPSHATADAHPYLEEHELNYVQKWREGLRPLGPMEEEMGLSVSQHVQSARKRRGDSNNWLKRSSNKRRKASSGDAYLFTSAGASSRATKDLSESTGMLSRPSSTVVSRSRRSATRILEHAEDEMPDELMDNPQLSFSSAPARLNSGAKHSSPKQGHKNSSQQELDGSEDELCRERAAATLSSPVSLKQPSIPSRTPTRRFSTQASVSKSSPLARNVEPPPEDVQMRDAAASDTNSDVLMTQQDESFCFKSKKRPMRSFDSRPSFKGVSVDVETADAVSLRAEETVVTHGVESIQTKDETMGGNDDRHTESDASIPPAVINEPKTQESFSSNIHDNTEHDEVPGQSAIGHASSGLESSKGHDESQESPSTTKNDTAGTNLGVSEPRSSIGEQDISREPSWSPDDQIQLQISQASASDPVPVPEVQSPRLSSPGSTQEEQTMTTTAVIEDAVGTQQSSQPQGPPSATGDTAAMTTELPATLEHAEQSETTTLSCPATSSSENVVPTEGTAPAPSENGASPTPDGIQSPWAKTQTSLYLASSSEHARVQVDTPQRSQNASSQVPPELQSPWIPTPILRCTDSPQHPGPGEQEAREHADNSGTAPATPGHRVSKPLSAGNDSGARQSTPEPQFSVKSFASFMTPSPERRVRRAPRSYVKPTMRLPSTQGILSSALKNPWASSKSSRRVSWATLPCEHEGNTASTHNDSWLGHSNSPCPRTARPVSPPPAASLEELDIPTTSNFISHFTAVTQKTDGFRPYNSPAPRPDNISSSEDTTSCLSAPVNEPVSEEEATAGQNRWEPEFETEMDDLDTPNDTLEDLFRDIGEMIEAFDVDAELEEARRAQLTRVPGRGLNLA